MKKTLIIATILLFIFLVYYFAFYAEEKNTINKNGENESSFKRIDVNKGNSISAPAPPPSLQSEIDRRVSIYNKEKSTLMLSFYRNYKLKGGKMNYSDYTKQFVINELSKDPQFSSDATSYIDMLNLYNTSVMKNYGLNG